MENQGFDLTELFAQQTSDDLVKEANAFKTLPSGKYRLTAAKLEGRIASEKSPWPGQKMIHVQVSAQGAERKGTLFIDLCVDPLRKENGKLEGPSKLWGQYVKALDMVGHPAGEVIDALKLYPVDAFVTEAFKMPDATYQYPRNPDEQTKAIDEGGEPKNFVQNIFAAK